MLFIKGIIIGLGKIIPGVSGAMLAITLGVYEQAINSITNFHDSPKKNIIFITKLGIGILVAIILGSKILSYLFINHYVISMLFFMGLITGGSYVFYKEIDKKKYLVIILSFLLLVCLTMRSNNIYLIKNTFYDYVVFFLGGFVDMFASIVPGISGTALLMLMGIYDSVLLLISSIYDVSFVFDNIWLYVSYGLGMFLSFIIISYIISSLFKKHRNITCNVIMGLCLATIILLIKMLNFREVNIYGIITFFLGCIIAIKIKK